MNIEQITAYRTTDGKVHADQTIANCHQASIDFNQSLEKLVRDNVGYSDYQDTTIDFIRDNSTELTIILNRMFSQVGALKKVMPSTECNCECPDGEGQHLEGCNVYNK